MSGAAPVPPSPGLRQQWDTFLDSKDISSKIEDATLVDMDNGANSKLYKAVLALDGDPETTWKEEISVALKKIPFDINDSNSVLWSLNEVQIWSRLDHPHILKLQGIYVDGGIFLASEFQDGGDLSKLIFKPGITIVDKLKWLASIADAIKYMHSHNFLHGDIKQDNIFISGKGEALLGDFGEAIDLAAYGNARISYITPYVAPETFAKTGPPKTKATDVFAFALLMFEVITGQRAYPGLRDYYAARIIVLEEGKRPEWPNPPGDVTANLRSLITACWDTEPGNRPTMAIVFDLLQPANLNLPHDQFVAKLPVQH